MKRHGAALSNIEITANIAALTPCAKKYSADFTLRKDKTTQPLHYTVIFMSRGVDDLEQAFKEFTARKLPREAKPSIRKALSVLWEAAGRSLFGSQEDTGRGNGSAKPDLKKMIITNLPYLLFV